MQDANCTMARPIQSAHAPALILKGRPAQPGDGLSIASRLRAADRAELTAAGVHDIPALLEAACARGYITIVGEDASGCPMLIFGTESAVQFQSWGPSAAIWMLACEGIERHARQIARQSHSWTQAVIAAHGPGASGHNMVDARNALHLRWLKWCGAVFTGNAYFPTSPDLPFLEFYIPPCVSPS